MKHRHDRLILKNIVGVDKLYSQKSKFYPILFVKNKQTQKQNNNKNTLEPYNKAYYI